MSKNYIGFVNDHSGSMRSLVDAAIKDYNATIATIKDAATTEMLDTVVSVVGIGLGPGGNGTKRQVVISNPHVLRPLTDWPCPGNTPLYDGIGDMIELLSGLPDADDPKVSMLVMITTDGGENGSRRYNASTIRALIEKMQKTGRWTFVFRVPASNVCNVSDLGVPRGNIQAWDTTAEGMEASTVANATAIRNYTTSRAGGQSASGAFYADAANINTTKLIPLPKKDISLYVAKPEDAGIMMRDFILKHRSQYLKGSAFYQLTKTESNIQHDKLVLIQDRASGEFFGGLEARRMIGLPDGRNARVHPGDHGNYNIFIQSKAINRKVVAGAGVAYYAKIGVPFTQAELDLFAPKDATTPVVATPAKVLPVAQQLPVVNNISRKPVKSPNPVVPRPPAFHYFETRDDARAHCKANGISQQLIQNDKALPKGRRWIVQITTK